MQHIQTNLNAFAASVQLISPLRVDGKVSNVVGLVIEASLPRATMGELCQIYTRNNEVIRAEIVGFRGEKVLMMPLDQTVGISPGSRVIRSPRPLSVGVGPGLLGRVIDGLGNPIDGKGPLVSEKQQAVYRDPPGPLERERIHDILSTGVRSIDGLVTIGKGQRVGIFAGSGVGKSVLLGMIARYTSADINVIALIGERGREVREFIERDLGPAGLSRSVVVVATSDQAAMVRVKGSLIAIAIAEYFRDSGRQVLLLMDSLSRVAMAQREIGLAVGEPPTTKGYTPSVFALLPRLLERAGTAKRGSITGLYTVLVEGDDLDEPISDASRAILDGHIVLSRHLATRGQYPAIDVNESISRLRTEVADETQLQDSQAILELLADYRDAEDMINIGAYVSGSNPKVDRAIEKIDLIRAFLKQDMRDSAPLDETRARMSEILQGLSP